MVRNRILNGILHAKQDFKKDLSSILNRIWNKLNSWISITQFCPKWEVSDSVNLKDQLPRNLKLIHHDNNNKKNDDDVDDVGILHCRQSKNVRVIHVATGCLITYQLIRKLKLWELPFGCKDWKKQESRFPDLQAKKIIKIFL